MTELAVRRAPPSGALRRRSVGPPAARSVLLTVLGEYAMPRGGAVWQESLVAALVDARPHRADGAPGGRAQHPRRLALRRARSAAARA